MTGRVVIVRVLNEEERQNFKFIESIEPFFCTKIYSTMYFLFLEDQNMFHSSTRRPKFKFNTNYPQSHTYPNSKISVLHN